MNTRALVSCLRCVAPTGDRIGEGAAWHAAHDALYWADISRFLVHRYTPRDGAVKSWFFDEAVTAVVLTDHDDELLVVLGSRLILWQPASDRRRDHGFRLRGWPGVRLNDARADPRGSLWVGSMSNNVKPDGSEGTVSGAVGELLRIDPDGRVSVFRRDIGISNTVAWSPDGRRFYFGDSIANTIWIYDYQLATGIIENERPYLSGLNRGIPDGSAVDSLGYVWNCRFYGGCVVRVSPNGAVDQIIEMPVTNVTTCTFGGPDYKTLFVTTALSEAPGGERLAGGLFALQSSVPGLPERRFRLGT